MEIYTVILYGFLVPVLGVSLYCLIQARKTIDWYDNQLDEMLNKLEGIGDE